MAFRDIVAELRGSVPKIPYSICGTYVNRAWRTVREANLWSFLLFDGQWISPPQYTGVSASTTQGSATVVLSAADSTMLAALLPLQPYSPITSRQFRVQAGGIYNIRGYVPGTNAILTLDRWFGEPTSAATSFQIYQCYYVPNAGGNPVTAITDFKSWLSVRDMANFRSLGVDHLSRRELDQRDPQRTWYGIPTDVVPFDNDPVSGALLFELWGAPTFNIVYQLYGVRRGLDLTSPTATLPPAVGEDAVFAQARVYAYEWAEANKELAPRNVGPDWKFLIGAAQREATDLMQSYRRADRERVDNWLTSHSVAGAGVGGAHYNSIGHTANPGGVP